MVGGEATGACLSEEVEINRKADSSRKRSLVLSPLHTLGGGYGDEEDEEWFVFTFNYKRNTSFLKMQIIEMYKVKNLRALICLLLDPLLRS